MLTNEDILPDFRYTHERRLTYADRRTNGEVTIAGITFQRNQNQEIPHAFQFIFIWLNISDFILRFYLYLLYSVVHYVHIVYLCHSGFSHCVHPTGCSHDCDLDPVTLILDLDLDILKMYPLTENVKFADQGF